MMLIDDGAFYQRVLVQKGELIEPSLGWGRRPGPVLVQELVGSYIQVGETLSVTLCILECHTLYTWGKHFFFLFMVHCSWKKCFTRHSRLSVGIDL